MAKLSSYRLWLASFAVAVAIAGAGATQFTVGGANGWSVPAAGAEPFNTWSVRTRFQVGDSLVFVYPKDQDSVLLVEPPEYNACNTSAYVQRFDDGDTVYSLDRPGALFFISGVEANCRNNEKLIVMVLAAGNNGTGGGAAAPTTPAPPSPPPASPSPPPATSAAPPPPSPPAASPPPPATSASVPPPASAPTTPPSTPATPPRPAPSASSPATPPSAAAGAPPAPPARAPAPSAHGTTTANSTGTPPSHPAGGSKQKNGAGVAVAAGLASSLGACVLGYAMLAL